MKRLLLLLLLCLLPSIARADRLFLVAPVAAKADPSEIDMPDLSAAGLPGHIDGAFKLGPAPLAADGKTPQFYWDVLAPAGVAAKATTELSKTGSYVGKAWSDVRKLPADQKSALMGKVVQRQVPDGKGGTVTATLTVSQADTVAGEVVVQSEVVRHKFFGVNDGEDG